MMNLHPPAARLAALLLCVTPWAALAQHEGHNHDHDAAPAAAGPALPRFAAVSESFELVGILDGRQLTLYLDRAADNSPVKGATLELEFGGAPLAVTPHGEGEFEATLATPPQPGVIPVTATVLAGDESDLLVADLDLHDDHAVHDTAAAATAGRSSIVAAAWAGGGVLALVLAALGLRRWRSASPQRFGGAA